MNKIARTKLLLGAMAVAFSCDASASGPLPQNPGLTDALKPAALPSPEQLGLSTLEDRLRETNAIAPLKKLALKLEIDDLQESFKVAHAEGASVASLRPAYDKLIAKVQASLKKDPKLSRDLMASKEAIWAALADPAQFASLD